ncbi:hypothetical protein QS552_25000, partial [Escherichia coli]|nr:hypothetical protein [Escherichia coli]MDL7104510.1 hypothetical protein [Escherichia coli]MDL7123585.1 hypothetical protein [Escherichia coli]MDL7128419.1 hypothetical protein [Escherichia coli]MDL7133316.1 hypothetical protein [Escherichia coli]
LLRQKQKKLIMLPSETMIWQPEFTDKTLSRKPGAVQSMSFRHVLVAGTVAISTLARVHSNLLPLIEESYQFSG